MMPILQPMPRVAPANESRSCLVVGPGSAMDSIRSALSAPGLELLQAATEKAALAALDRFPVVAAFVDRQLGTTPVSSIIASAGHRTPGIPVLVVGTSANVQDAVDAMQNGAADYLVVPLAPVVVLDRLQRVLEHNGPAAPTSPFVGLVGSSAALRRVYETIWKISRYKTNVLLLGESGTRQGADRPRAPRARSPPPAPVRAAELRHARPRDHRERALRPRAWRVHRRERAQARPVRAR